MAELKKTAKTTVKKTAAKTAPDKEAVKAAAVTVEVKALPTVPAEDEKKTESAGKAPARKPAARKRTDEKPAARKPSARKTSARKAVSNKTAMSKAAVHFQFDGRDLVAGEVLKRAEAHYKKLRRGVEIKDFELYIVASEGAAYYVVNGEGSDDFKVML